MPQSVRERVRWHREEARSKGLVRVEVEIPRHLLQLRHPDETVKALLIRALTALLPPATRPPPPPLPETLPETQPPMPAAKKLPETLPETAQAQFIALWQQGLEITAIAAQLGIKWTTAQSRARRLQLKGLIQPRPRGGDYPSRRVQARQTPETP